MHPNQSDTPPTHIIFITMPYLNISYLPHPAWLEKTWRKFRIKRLMFFERILA